MGHDGIRNFKGLMLAARFGIVLIKEIQDISILQLIVFFFLNITLKKQTALMLKITCHAFHVAWIQLGRSHN